MSNDLLKDWLHRKDVNQGDKLLITLGTFDGPRQLKDVLSRAEEAGFKRKSWSNPSASLSRMSGHAIHTESGWEITKKGREKLAAQGVPHTALVAANVASDLREMTSRVSDGEVREFLGEAIGSYEVGHLRSAVVMSWVAAVYVLQLHVLKNHAHSFNTEAKRLDGKWKSVKTPDDFGRMKESDFLDRLVGIGVLGKNVKTALKECLDRRNACGHPNSYKLGANTVAAHLECLLLNVFSKF